MFKTIIKIIVCNSSNLEAVLTKYFKSFVFWIELEIRMGKFKVVVQSSVS